MTKTNVNLRETPEYLNCGFKVIVCPICGQETLDSHWICDECGWEYDGRTQDNQYSSCNKSTILEYRNRYLSNL